MKRIGLFLCTAFLLFLLTACSNSEQGGQQNTQSVNNKPSMTEGQTSAETDKVPQSDDSSQSENDTQTENAAQPGEIPQTQEPEKEKEKNNMLTIQIGDKTLTATLENNSSAEALKELLSKGSLTLNMSDYGGMEKTAALPEKLPRNDESINTDAGDLILYQGNIITIYYDTNSWSLTRLGKINNITKSELQEILGKGDVSVTFSVAS
ncbi:MAG: hypothetical protein K2N36_04035 [Ruminiclostridium sp.]|nr:hypothetical protein [Ruminiclostridium sp.]